MPKDIASIPLAFLRLPETDMRERAAGFRSLMDRRRTVRDFSSKSVDPEIIRDAIMTAASAPSGANQQPWHFVAISDPAIKHEIRIRAEDEERAFYAGRAGEEWLDALAPLGTDWEKQFLETAPWLIAIFAERYGLGENGARIKNYYVPESVSIATGFLIAALHQAGLATLTHTPSPMGFLNEICDRPQNEKPLILLVVGYPSEDAHVPAITRKGEPEVLTWKTGS